MTGHEPGNATSHRCTSLSKKLRNKKYRDGYVSSHVRTFLANQLASLQGEMSQKEFGELLGKPQPIVSRLQNPNYGKYTLHSLLDMASKLDVAFFARFVDYPTFLKLTNDFSDEALRPSCFDPNQLDLLDTIPHSIQTQPSSVGEMAPSGIAKSGLFIGSTVVGQKGIQSSMLPQYASISGGSHS